LVYHPIWLVVLSGCLYLTTLSVRAEPTPGHDAFMLGIAAFREARYEDALAAFTAARAAGHEDPNLSFNLGLTLYRLEAFDDARAVFESLRASPRYTAVAEYQLGLIAAREDRIEDAVAHFHKAEWASEQAPLRELARVARHRLQPDAVRRRPLLYLYAGGGYDGNPALLNENFDPLRDADGRGFYGLQGLVQWPLKAGPGRESDFQGGAYLQEYMGLDRFDQTGLQARLRWHQQGRQWRNTQALAAEATWLDGEWLQSIAHLEVAAIRQDNGTAMQLHAQFSAIRASSAFAALDGWRVRSGARWSRSKAGLLWRADYELEYNDRHNLRVDEQFFSQSPLRNQLRLELLHGSANQLALEWQLRYRHSRYIGTNRLVTPDGQVGSERRQDQLLSVGVQARHALGRRLGLLAEYRYDANRSRLEVFDYNRHLLSLGLEWQP
jgi:hypothetical protein